MRLVLIFIVLLLLGCQTRPKNEYMELWNAIEPGMKVVHNLTGDTLFVVKKYENWTTAYIVVRKKDYQTIEVSARELTIIY